MGRLLAIRVADLPRRVLSRTVAFALALVVADVVRGEQSGLPVTLRITWGGGKPAAHAGRIELIDPATPPAATEWRMLSPEPLAPATMHGSEGVIEVHEPRGLDMNGVDLKVADWRRARLRVRIGRSATAEEPVVIDAAVADLLAAPAQKPLDRDGNRLSVSRAPGDELRASFMAGESAIRRPGETVGVVVHPLLPAAAASAAAYELKVRVRRSGAAAESHVQTQVVGETNSNAAGMREFLPVTLAVPLPPEEGGCDIEFEFVERGGLRWSRSVASRTLQVVAVADKPMQPANAAWAVTYELDPGSPKLLERLRRLPGMGLPSIAVPSVTLPKLPRPSFGLPKVSLPTPSFPHVPLPSVPVPKLPSVNTMVPRLTGLLAVGHSTLESHGLGPMLRLPPADDGPAWEAVALPAGEPGMPQLVEVEYPLEQEMTLALAVLEESNGEVRATATSGVDLRLPAVDDRTRHGRIGTRRFVYWPRTRAPLLVITNLSGRSPALFGKIRVLAGPRGVASQQQSPPGARKTYLHIPEPDFTLFGAGERANDAVGAAFTDWDAFLGGIRRSADWAAAQGAAGALVGVYAAGAAVWPTNLTHGAPRWDSGGGLAGGIDPEPKDVLGLLCRIYARENLRLVPAVVGDGSLPALDGLVAQGDAAGAGVVAVGRDGGPIVTDGGRGPHYNILDPRVQAAFEAIVVELAGRLRDATCVDGIAILIRHDGWLHLPGVAAGLDDATFARFAAEAGADVQSLVRPALAAGDGSRFAARAALVEGPLRDRWLAWREGIVAGFHARLAATLASVQPRWNLYVMPTTLFAAGRFAERFRPNLAVELRDADVLREAGLDPGRITAGAGIVYVAPHVHTAACDEGQRGVVLQANRSLALLRGTAGAARAGVLLVEQPQAIDPRDAAVHASFAAKPAAAVGVVAPAGGVDVRRALAESFIAADAEVVFDAGLVHACIEEDDEQSRQAIGSLPPQALDVVAAVPAPLVMRARAGESGLWVSAVNACGTACRAVIALRRQPTAIIDAVTKAALPAAPGGEVVVPLEPWEVRTIILEAGDQITSVRADFDPAVGGSAAALLADLQARRAALEMPAPLAVLDNPGFDLPELDGVVPGWELVESGRGTLRRVPGRPSDGGSGMAFSSENGLATLRSNPFRAPASGRISVAMWVRAGGADLQPPLRIAIEGVLDDREFYRFAPVGRGSGAMPLATAWSQFVLQVDDLPTRGLESLRVRLDLLGPGAVEIDDVRVFNLAFDESQRVRLSKILAAAAERAAAGDIGGSLVELDGPWPRFLRAHVTAAQGVAVDTPQAETSPNAAQPARSGGVVDRVRRWWQ